MAPRRRWRRRRSGRRRWPAGRSRARCGRLLGWALLLWRGLRLLRFRWRRRHRWWRRELVRRLLRDLGRVRRELAQRGGCAVFVRPARGKPRRRRRLGGTEDAYHRGADRRDDRHQRRHRVALRCDHMPPQPSRHAPNLRVCAKAQWRLTFTPRYNFHHCRRQPPPPVTAWCPLN